MNNWSVEIVVLVEIVVSEAIAVVGLALVKLVGNLVSNNC